MSNNRYIPPHRRRQPLPSQKEEEQEHTGVDKELLLCNAFNRICCINLSQRPDKWRNIQRQALRVGTRFQQKMERFDAIDGNKAISRSSTADSVELEWDTTQNSMRDRHVQPGIRRMTPGEVGCALSHVNLWRELASNEGPGVTMLILEDDAEFLSDRNGQRSWRKDENSSCSRFLEAFSKMWTLLPDDWGIFYFGFSDRGERIPVQTCESDQEQETKGAHPLQVKLFRPTYGFQTHAYAITCAAATALLSNLPVRGPIDVWLADNQWFGLHAYCGVVANEGWRGTGAWLSYQRKESGSDVIQSGRAVKN